MWFHCSSADYSPAAALKASSAEFPREADGNFMRLILIYFPSSCSSSCLSFSWCTSPRPADHCLSPDSFFPTLLLAPFDIHLRSSYSFFLFRLIYFPFGYTLLSFSLFSFYFHCPFHLYKRGYPSVGPFVSSWHKTMKIDIFDNVVNVLASL